MRIKVRELMAREGLRTAYQLAQFSGKRIHIRTATRLVSSGGKVERLDAKLLTALYDLFRLTTMDDLIER